MGRLNMSSMLVLPWLMFASLATAQPTIDSINVQGYMKRANGTAVTNGSYTMAFGVFQNGVAIWGRSYSVTVTNGLFSRTLSGAGTDLSALPAGTSMNSNFTAATLNPALLMGAGNGGVTIRVYAVSAIDGSNPQFDITYGSVPTAFVAETAKGVASGSVTLSGIASTAMTATSAGIADAGKLVRLDGAGLVDVSMIPPIPGSQIGSGSVGVTYGGTGASTAAGARTNLGAAASGANSDITSLTGLTTALSVPQGGTGATTASAARSNLGAAASGANSDITSITGLSTALSVGQGGTGATTAIAARAALGAAASGSNSDITELTGITTPITVAQGGTGGGTAAAARTSLGAAASGANSDITSLTGLTTALSVGQGGTGATTAGAARTALGAAASGANSDITSITGLSTPLSLGQGGSNANLTAVNGGVVYSTGSAMAISAAGTSGQVLTSAGAGAPTWSTVSSASTRSRVYYFDDYMSPLTAAANATTKISDTIFSSATGGGTIATLAAPAANALGNARFTAGTTNNAAAWLGYCSQNAAAGTATYGSRFETTDNWTYEVRFNVATAVAANQGLLRFGVMVNNTAGAAAARGAYVELPANSTTLSANVRNAGGGGAIAGTATVTAGGTTYSRVTIAYDGTNVTFSHNGTQFATTTTNIPSTLAMCPAMHYVGGTVTRNIDIDYQSWTHTTSR